MRLTTVILISALMQVSAATFGQRITMSSKDTSLDVVLKEIRKQSGYNFFYDGKAISKSQKVSVSVSNAALSETLDIALKGLGLSYEITGKSVSIKVEEPSMLGRLVNLFTNIDVRGRVTGTDRIPLPNATITVKGTSTKTVTDSKGQFFLQNVDENSVLQISFIGYKSREVKASSNLGDIALEVLSGDLREVVVEVSTGYQTLSKERSAGSFAKPDMKILADRSTSMNILQRLDGLIPGFTYNAAPLSRNAYSIRGLATIGLDANGGGTNRNPLFVVDGIPIENIASINPQDVDDITVLKDATAASIWGARASNGVIVITTKRGKQNEKIKIEYDAFINFQGKPDLDYLPVLTSKDYIQTAREIFSAKFNPWENLTTTGLAPHETILYNQYRNLITADQANKSLDSLASIDNHQQIKDLFYRNSAISNQTISLSGGGDVYAVYGSLAHTNVLTPRPGEKNNTFKVNLRQDFNVNKRVKLNLITDITNTLTSTNRLPTVDYRFYPYQLFQDATGKNISMPYVGVVGDSLRRDYEARSRVSLDYVPLDETNYGYTKNDNLLSRITGGATVKLFKGLRFEGVYGYMKSSSRSTSYDDAKAYRTRREVVQFTVAPTVGSTPRYYLPNTGGRFGVTNQNQRNWTIRNQFIYDNAWQDRKHQVTLLAGQEAQDQFTIRNTSLVRGYNEVLQSFVAIDYATLGTTGAPSPVLPTQSGRSTLSNDNFSQAESQLRFTSYYASGGYTYNRKYTVNGSWRIDQSNLFGIDKSAQNRPVWSAGLKWVLSEESFMKGLTWIDQLAVRGTYGITGNSPAPGSASSYDILSSASSNFLPIVGLQIATAANRKLTWESTKTINLGFDFSVLNRRLSGSIDVYRKRTEDLLGQMVVNGFTGYSSIVGNYGNMENRGIELGINSLNINSRNFSWNSSLNLAYNKNMITQLNNPRSLTSGIDKAQAQFESGFPAFAIFAFKYAGLDNLGDPQIRLADGTITKAANGQVDPGDVLFAGTYQPVWSGGFSNSFRYKDLTLSANIIVNLGHVMRTDGAANYTNPFSGYSGRLTGIFNVLDNSDQAGMVAGQLHPNFLKRWKQLGDELITNIPSYVADPAAATRRQTFYYGYGDINVVSASFVKLRDVTLSYRLPKNLVSRIRTEDISFRVQLSNIMLWKANKDDIDPEFHDAAFGRRVPSVSAQSDINTTSYRFGQGTISIGAHINF